MTKKDQKIIADAEREGTPIFVLTAKDKLSVEALIGYWSSCDTESCDPIHLIGVQQRINEFESWQRANPDKVKLPD